MSGLQDAPWTVMTLLSAVSLAALGAYLWRRRSVRGARPLAVAMLVMTAWCLAYAAQLAADDEGAREAWFLVGDLLTLPAATVSLWFALEYAGLERLMTRRRVLLLVGVMVVLSAAYLVDGGRLMWADLWFDGTVLGELAPLGLVATAYIFVLAVSATGVFVLLFVRSPAHRAPVVLIIIAHVSLRMALALDAMGAAPVPGVPTMVVALDITALMYTIALFRFRLFDLLPVARETIIERMPDGLLVLDADDRVVDLNAAAQRLLDLPVPMVRRQPAETVLAAFPELAARIAEQAAGPLEASIETRDGPRVLEVTATTLADWQQRPIGRLVLLHDITALRAVEAQLLEQEGALAGTRERERLARELHDGLAQDLWLAKLKSGRLATQPELGSESRAIVEELTAAVDTGLDEARHAVAALRLDRNGGQGLGELLARMLQDFEDRFGLAVDLDEDGDLPAVEPRAEAEVLRIVQEALTNVRRHADATVVRVRVTRDGRGLVLEIRDNGRGFDPGATGDDAYGLAGMRERAALVGGTLEIESAPRRGTTVRVVLPASGAPTLAAART